jgi:murein L,D-transpeptidase YcbB/YkuD
LLSAVLDYARAQRGVVGTHFPKDWAIRPEPYDAAGDLAAARAQNRLSEWLAALPPPFEAYRNLLTALDRYRQIRDAGGWERLTGPLPIREGMRGAPVKSLKTRLAREGYGALPIGDDDAFDPALQEAVMRFQGSHGLRQTGIVDVTTRAALNVPVDRRVGQIVANLERWRWLPRDLPATRVEVNIAAADVNFIKDNKSVLPMRAIIGRPSKRTPMFEAQINAIIVNPSWYVPAEIAAKEVLPKAARDPGFMEREGFVVEADPARPGHTRVRQRPGDLNALGHIKFELPNSFDVYLHDTPVRQLFDRDRRALSHGCIRVEKPLDFASALLEGDPLWSGDSIVQAIAEGGTRRIELIRPVPVFVLYWTAFVGQDGIVNFRDDLYRWDELLLHEREIG